MEPAMGGGDDFVDLVILEHRRPVGHPPLGPHTVLAIQSGGQLMHALERVVEVQDENGGGKVDARQFPDPRGTGWLIMIKD